MNFLLKGTRDKDISGGLGGQMLYLSSMKIHFVCVGNTFRSRLCEAYLKSLKIKDLEVTSSGVKASTNENGNIAWDTKVILEKHGILSFASESWVQTDSEVIEDKDLIIFMEQMQYDFCSNLHLKIPNFEIWNIKDIDNRVTPEIVLEQAEEIFLRIKNLVDDLAKKLN